MQVEINFKQWRKRKPNITDIKNKSDLTKQKIDEWKLETEFKNYFSISLVFLREKLSSFMATFGTIWF